MTTATATARQRAIRLSEKVRRDPVLAKALGIQVNFHIQLEIDLSPEDIQTEPRKDVEHE